ncbi:ferritin-like domain-containing protein [Mycena maculata]|uniref:Ferritin-like domain-containing protein n=1 Tax=Mycena maculata TaxID=230809 RepID=A0AAD7P2L2_9AGAR|nr:ferritin-like domain-containing protein [Mycena maculata]
MHCFSSTLAALAAAPLLASALPIVNRAASANVVLVFQFANVLQQLEGQFYQQGLAKFQDSDFQTAGFSSGMIATQVLSTIQSDEATHESFIQQTLIDNGATPLTCNFSFDSALADVPTLAATARVVEYIGVSAFLGGANLLDDPIFLDAAASILTVEARHQTLLNILSGTGSAIPSAFDIALTPQEVLSIAGGFITGPCNTGIIPTNPLTVNNTGPISSGTLLTVSATNITGTDGLFCNMIVGGANFAINMPLAQCVVPGGINGPVALWITNDDQPLANDVVYRGSSQQIAGPAIFFVDSQPEMLGQLVRSSPSSSDDASDGAAAAPTPTPLPPNIGPSPDGPSPDDNVIVNGVSSVPATTPSAPSP